jgi:hypothetical protein
MEHLSSKIKAPLSLAQNLSAPPSIGSLPRPLLPSSHMEGEPHWNT